MGKRGSVPDEQEDNGVQGERRELTLKVKTVAVKEIKQRVDG